VIFIVDTHAWLENAIGSKKGTEVQKLFDNENNKLVTMECCIAEIQGYCLKNNFNFSLLYGVIRKNSLILPVLREHWIKAAKIKHELRKKIKNFGLIDSILVAKQQELNCKIITGDSHFKNLKNVVFIG
jgi:predicted nucleic acid-binding protein|tara:strand:- start:44 stop:430 length:387 start_codon:yes stop_codon:yes gene_type:complete